jgi:hypothetical protein
MRVDLLTPLHIGTGNEVPAYEYRDDGDGYVRLSLAAVLGDPELARKPASLATSDEVYGYLASLPSLRPGHMLYRLARHGEPLRRSRPGERPVGVRECLKAALRQGPILPGSSLKGALLTAWLFGKYHERLTGDFTRQPADRRDKRRDTDRLENVADRDYDGRQLGAGGELAKGENPEWAFRDAESAKSGRRLSDRLGAPDVALGGDLRLAKAHRPLKSRPVDQWVECVGARAFGRERVRFLESPKGRYTLAELCRRANLFARCVLVAEQQFFDYCIGKGYISDPPTDYRAGGSLEWALVEAEKQPLCCLVRLGWGSSKNATSVALLNSVAELKKQPSRPGRDAAGYFWAAETMRPKSRWLLEGDVPLGWCRVTFEEGDREPER